MLVLAMVMKYFKMINKRGISGVVTVVILVALSIALVAIVWGVVQNMIQGDLDKSESCSSLFSEDVVKLNNDYTCYGGDELGNDADYENIYFSIKVGNEDIDSLLVKIEGGALSKTYELSPTSLPSNLVSATGESFPAKNSGITYRLNIEAEGMVKPFSIGVSPVLGGYTCNEIDRINDISWCSRLTDNPEDPDDSAYTIWDGL
jgi:hypothetical protein